MASRKPLSVCGGENEPGDSSRNYVDFLSGQRGLLDDWKEIRDLGVKRILIEASDLHPAIADRLRCSYSEACQFTSAVVSLMGGSAQKPELQFGFSSEFAERLTPRLIRGKHVGRMVTIRGFVSSCTPVVPRLTKCVQYCEANKRLYSFEATASESASSGFTCVEFPSKNDFGDDLRLESGLSDYTDTQILTITDTPESFEPGEIPRQIQAVLERDLVDRCKVGDRVEVVGFCMPVRKRNRRLVAVADIDMEILANNVQTKFSEVFPAFVFDDDLKKFNELSKKSDCFEILARSIAPSIKVHEEVKQGLLCMMLGGREFTSNSGIHHRGDIHVLLVGDTATGKSQLLRRVSIIGRCVQKLASISVSATGKMATADGLTAMVTHDPFTDLPTLRGGAAVQADRGILCIDEFGKLQNRCIIKKLQLSTVARESISEVMEKGTVTISRPGIQGSLNARCSVLAASNTVYGRYQRTKSASENIGFDEAFLSRFDIMFLMLEDVYGFTRIKEPHVEGEDVESLAAFLLDVLRYREETNEPEPNSMQVWESAWGSAPKVLSTKFLRSYIKHAKHLEPRLSKRASAYLSERYAYLREKEENKNPDERMFPVTPKTLDSMIRLSVAHARSRLAARVEPKDAEAAFTLMYRSCFREVPEKKSLSQIRREAKAYVQDQDLAVKLDQPLPSSQPAKPRFSARKKQVAVKEEDAAKTARAKRTLTDESYNQGMAKLRKIFSYAHNSLDENTVLEQLASLGVEPSEAKTILDRMSDENKIMLAEGLVILI